MPTNLRTRLAFGVVLALAACTPSPPPTANARTVIAEPIPIDQTNSARSDRWTVVQPTISVPPMAAIASRERGAYLTVACRTNSATGAAIVLTSADDPTDWPEARHLTLAFDGAAPAAYPWLPTRFTRTLWGFYIDAYATDFPQAIAALTTHGAIEAVAKEQGKEVFRQHFTLQGAVPAINAALKSCPLAAEAPRADAARWGVIKRTTTGNTLVVGILRPGTDHGIEVLCNENARKVGIMIWPREPFAGPSGNLRLALGFDDEKPERRHWNASAVVFDTWSTDPGFSALIEDLRSHRSVTVSMGPSGQEQSEVFSLDGAEAAIGRALAACGQS